MKKIITAALACAMIISSLCSCAPAQEELPPLPEKYSLIDEGLATPVRNQGRTSLCSAYAVINSAETNLVINGYVDKDEVDFSEGHTFYYYLTFADDPVTDMNTDGIYSGGNRLEDDGSLFQNNFAASNSCIAAMYANGIGPVDESLVEFDPNNYRGSVGAFHEAHSSGEISKFMGDYLLVEANAYNSHFINPYVYESSPIESIKRDIIKNGAIACGTSVEMYYFTESGQGLNYYQGVFDDDESIGRFIKHATTIVGWDDNYSRENFGAAKPEKDGAWLIQDSQGSELGRDGCYWVSYEQPLPDKKSVVMCPREKYGDIYYYDSNCMLEYLEPNGSSITSANVFTAKKDSSLKAVGVPTSAIDQPVTVEVFVNPQNGCPNSGKRAAKLSAVIERPGYHVVDLKETVALSEGDTFSIVITYAADKSGSDSWLGRVPVEGDYPKDILSGFPSSFDIRVSSNPGESYVVHDGKWHDTSDPATAELFGLDVNINNFGIKALMENDS